jgi:hypothetical protein
MDAASVASDHQFAIGPLGILVSADQKFQGELFENGVVDDLEFNFGKGTENSAWFSNIFHEKFVGEVGEQRVDHDVWFYVR